MENKNMISFWQFLNENKVEIPIIQRDYAQGRLGREYVRKNFLENLKSALDGQPIKLDFVYGSIEDGKNLQPLDGQQRLTTLWLLHWYIALKSGNLTAENCEVLNKFTYETRASSREFCENLCNPKNFESFKGSEVAKDVVKYIKNQTWFYSVWQQDPTIQSMLRMLSGTGKNDGIEPLFKDENLEEIWKKLTEENKTEENKITFYHLSLNNFGLSDNLYVKMNARGKQLTDFENFKADLVGYIREEAKGEEDWKQLLNAQTGIPIKMDTTWTDIFWENKSADNKIDEIYFAFFNRFFWNERFICKSKKDNKFLFTDEDESYKQFEKNLNYSGLSNYMYLKKEGSEEKEIPITLLKKFDTVLDHYENYTDKKIEYSKWVKDFTFIPQYKNGEVLKLANKSHRFLFYAMTKYFSEGIGDLTKLEHWIRVVCNLAGRGYNSEPLINADSELRTAISYVEMLDSHNVYESLSNQPPVVDNPTAFELQWNEEIIKAKKICEDNLWENKFIKAENFAFFNGTIRFLYQGPDGGEDWDDFDKKWENVHDKYFEKEEPEEANKSCLKGGSNSAELLKALISRFQLIKREKNDFLNILWNFALYYNNKYHGILNNHTATWRFYLTHRTLTEAVHKVLCGETDVKHHDTRSDGNFYFEKMINQLTETKLLDDMIPQWNKLWLHDYYFESLNRKEPVLHDLNKNIKNNFDGKNYVLLAAQRDDFLRDERIRILEDNNRIKDTNLRYGLATVFFEYQGRNFVWRSDNLIYYQLKDDYHGGIQDENGNWVSINPHDKTNDQILELLKEVH